MLASHTCILGIRDLICFVVMYFCMTDFQITQQAGIYSIQMTTELRSHNLHLFVHFIAMFSMTVPECANPAGHFIMEAEYTCHFNCFSRCHVHVF